jgi:DNA-binding beta-propeller fold protein YncE
VDYGNSHLTLLSNSGVSLSGTTGYSGVINGTPTLFFPVAIAIDGSRNGWLANFSSNTVTKISADGTSAAAYVCCDAPDGLAIDGLGNVWVANYYGDSVSLLSAQGTLLSAGFKGGGIVHPQGIAVDGVGNVWVANYRGPSITELAGASSSNTVGTILSPATGWAPEAGLLEAFALAIDASGNIWVTSFGSNQLTEYVGLAAPVKTPMLGPVRVP